MSLCENPWPQNFDPDDILASISPAGVLSSDNLDVKLNDAPYLPDICVQPPTVAAASPSIESHIFATESTTFNQNFQPGTNTMTWRNDIM